MSDDISGDIRQFLHDNIQSVEQLEILLRLRSETARAWTSEAMSQAMYSTPSAVEMRLNDLVSRRLAKAIQAERTYLYNSTDAKLDELIDRLAELYKTRRVAIIGLIYSKQSAQVQAFAEAFRFRKD